MAVRKFGRDPVLDYHVRKRLIVVEIERWLGLYLNYDTVNAAVSGCGCGRTH